MHLYMKKIVLQITVLYVLNLSHFPRIHKKSVRDTMEYIWLLCIIIVHIYAVKILKEKVKLTELSNRKY